MQGQDRSPQTFSIPENEDIFTDTYQSGAPGGSVSLIFSLGLVGGGGADYGRSSNQISSTELRRS